MAQGTAMRPRATPAKRKVHVEHEGGAEAHEKADDDRPGGVEEGHPEGVPKGGPRKITLVVLPANKFCLTEAQQVSVG